MICLDLRNISPISIVCKCGFILIHSLTPPSDETWKLDLFNVVKALLSQFLYQTMFGFPQLVLNAKSPLFGRVNQAKQK